MEGIQEDVEYIDTHPVSKIEIMEIIIVVVAKHLFRPIMSADIFLKDILIISELLNAQIMTDISNSIII